MLANMAVLVSGLRLWGKVWKVLFGDGCYEKCVGC